MQLFLGYGITALYIFAFGPLARYLLSAPRTIGLEARVSDFFVVLAAAIVAMLALKLIVKSTKRKLGLRPGRPVGASARSALANRLTWVAILSAVFAAASVWVDRSDALDAFTPYGVMLVLVSLAGSLMVESLKKLLLFEPT